MDIVDVRFDFVFSFDCSHFDNENINRRSCVRPQQFRIFKRKNLQNLIDRFFLVVYLAGELDMLAVVVDFLTV